MVKAGNWNIEDGEDEEFGRKGRITLVPRLCLVCLHFRAGRACQAVRTQAEPGYEEDLCTLTDHIGQSANARDIDMDNVLDRQGEIIGGNDAGSGQQNDALGKAGFLAEPVY